MQDTERLNAAFAEMGAAAAEAARAMGKFVQAAAAAVNATLQGWGGLISAACIAAAYEAAKRENPQWVHRASFSKKKRTRKKYHDKIMRKYWRGNVWITQN